MNHVQYTETAPQSPPRPVLLDIMLGGRFVCQLKYTKRGLPKMIDGKIIECHDPGDLKRFVEEKRPSLKGKDYQIAFAELRRV